MTVTTMVCGGCGAEAPPNDPFRCPRARGDDDVDHLLTRLLDTEAIEFPVHRESDNPFLRFSVLTRAWDLGREHGIPATELEHLIEDLSAAVARVDGRRFVHTPLVALPELEQAWDLGGTLWAKDETNNVSGSHKARHLMGVMLYLRVAERLSLIDPQRPLAISSCGNAALAAAVIARAAARPIDVYIPEWADPDVVRSLETLDARLHRCPRDPNLRGDPCTHAFRQAVARGALPFSCQGTDNGLALEGGLTLGYELVAELHADPPDRIFIQVGGGALASACIQAWREAKEWGLVTRIPRFHAVQTENTAPLQRAYRKMVTRIMAELPHASANGGDVFADLESTARRADLLRRETQSRAVASALRHAATHRSHYMWAWESPPQSIAHGILDDETYDWLAVVRGMIASGGYPLTVSEELLEEARDTLRKTSKIRADATGSAGLAGLALLQRSGLTAPGERWLVLATGIDRQDEKHPMNGGRATHPGER